MTLQTPRDKNESSENPSPVFKKKIRQIIVICGRFISSYHKQFKRITHNDVHNKKVWQNLGR